MTFKYLLTFDLANEYYSTFSPSKIYSPFFRSYLAIQFNKLNDGSVCLLYVHMTHT